MLALMSLNGESHQKSEFVHLCVYFSDFKLAQRTTVRAGTASTFIAVFGTTRAAFVNVKEVRGKANFWVALTVRTMSISFIGGHLFDSLEKPPTNTWG
jgi:hypothetical protein